MIGKRFLILAWSLIAGAVLLSVADGYRVKSMVSGQVDLLRDKLHVAGGSAPPVVITIETTRGTPR